MHMLRGSTLIAALPPQSVPLREYDRNFSYCMRICFAAAHSDGNGVTEPDWGRSEVVFGHAVVRILSAFGPLSAGISA